jgi:hypothetical protein
LIDTKIGSYAKPVVFATLNRTPSPYNNGLWVVGLRRAGRAVDVGQIAKKLGECSELGFKTGGGHPYAAGVQCSDFNQSALKICNQIADICTTWIDAEELYESLMEEEECPNKRKYESTDLD